jgi:hypothetical protein
MWPAAVDEMVPSQVYEDDLREELAAAKRMTPPQSRSQGSPCVPAGGHVSGAVEIVGGLVYAASFGSRITASHWRSGRTVWKSSSGRYVPVSGNASRLLILGNRAIWAVTPWKRR